MEERTRTGFSKVAVNINESIETKFVRWFVRGNIGMVTYTVARVSSPGKGGMLAQCSAEYASQ